jgi:predicted O-methyltransferase YrrM
MDKIYKRFANGLHYFKLARAWSWRDYAAEYALIIGRLFGTTTDLYPERGMSRYNQLLDLIDENKPKRICEIGTWNGNRAIQMLQQAGKHHSAERLRYQGFDLFDQQTGEQFTREFSKNAWAEGVVHQRINATGADVDLIVGDTQETIVNLLKSDLYFVDGGHSVDTVENDGREVLSLLSVGGVAVFDDYYHTPVDGIGCNKFIDTLSAEWKVAHLPIVTTTGDGMKIGMVKVCRNMSMVA